MNTLLLEIAGLKEAFSYGAIDLACFLRNVARLELELELCGGVA